MCVATLSSPAHVRLWEESLRVGLKRREIHGNKPLNADHEVLWLKFYNEMRLVVEEHYPRIEDGGGGGNYIIRLPYGPRLIRFLWFMWCRANATQDFGTFIDEIDSNWKYFKADVVLVDTTDSKQLPTT